MRYLHRYLMDDHCCYYYCSCYVRMHICSHLCSCGLLLFSSSSPYFVKTAKVEPTETQMFKDVLDRVGEEFSKYVCSLYLPIV